DRARPPAAEDRRQTCRGAAAQSGRSAAADSRWRLAAPSAGSDRDRGARRTRRRPTARRSRRRLEARRPPSPRLRRTSDRAPRREGIEISVSCLSRLQTDRLANRTELIAAENHLQTGCKAFQTEVMNEALRQG